MGNYCKCKLTFVWDCCGQLCGCVEASVPLCLLTWVRVCAYYALTVHGHAFQIFLFFLNFISYTTAAAIHTFYITVLLELRIGV